MSHWRDRFRTESRAMVVEITKDTFTGKEDDLAEDEAVFLACTFQSAASSLELRDKNPTKMYAVSFLGGDKILFTPGNAINNLSLYALNPRGGIEKVTAEMAADKLDLLVPNMPFSNSKCCSTCHKPFDGGDAVYSIILKDGARRDFCRIHIRFAMKYNTDGALAYSFQATDDLDRADPVVLWKMITHMPQTVATMEYVVRDVVGYAKKVARRGRLSDTSKRNFEAVAGMQQATMFILKFAARRILGVQRKSLEGMVGAD